MRVVWPFFYLKHQSSLVHRNWTGQRLKQRRKARVRTPGEDVRNVVGYFLFGYNDDKGQIILSLGITRLRFDSEEEPLFNLHTSKCSCSITSNVFFFTIRWISRSFSSCRCCRDYPQRLSQTEPYQGYNKRKIRSFIGQKLLRSCVRRWLILAQL